MCCCKRAVHVNQLAAGLMSTAAQKVPVTTIEHTNPATPLAHLRHSRCGHPLRQCAPASSAGRARPSVLYSLIAWSQRQQACCSFARAVSQACRHVLVSPPPLPHSQGYSVAGTSAAPCLLNAAFLPLPPPLAVAAHLARALGLRIQGLHCGGVAHVGDGCHQLVSHGPLGGVARQARHEDGAQA